MSLYYLYKTDICLLFLYAISFPSSSSSTSVAAAACLSAVGAVPSLSMRERSSNSAGQRTYTDAQLASSSPSERNERVSHNLKINKSLF